MSVQWKYYVNVSARKQNIALLSNHSHLKMSLIRNIKKYLSCDESLSVLSCSIIFVLSLSLSQRGEKEKGHVIIGEKVTDEEEYLPPLTVRVTHISICIRFGHVFPIL